MTAWVTGIVAAGVTLALLTGVTRGFDTASLPILAGIVALGALAIAVARRAGTGTVGPGRCDGCGGLISPNAPVCKHCGAATAP
ncbi:MAG: hypothetical protein H0W55_01840 [Actinobacteria bacterium]|nr:hypothetical protein [Actinomycetota bacterium]MDQ3533821.1 hypothetical protein [Actinomycetota bacterium]